MAREYVGLVGRASPAMNARRGAATRLRRPFACAALLLAATLVPHCVSANKETHEYTEKEAIVVWTDKVGPYNNPQETYKYDTLGLCELEGNDIKVEEGDLSIGEAIEGHEFFTSPRINILFGESTSNRKVCNMVLSADKATALSTMIYENYWYQLYIDDLPIWAFVGEHSKFSVDVSRFAGLMKENRKANAAPTSADTAPAVPKHLKGKPLPRIFTHRHFTFFKNGNQVIEVDMEPSRPWPVYEGAPLNFTYTATWYQTNKAFKDRSLRYLDPKFFEHKVHWFSIVNSFMLCVFLCAVVAIILMKTLKRDFTRYSASDADELEMDGGDESGWKQVNGDVFRRPDHLTMFTILYATGSHLGCTVLCVLLFAVANSYYSQRGGTATSFVISYLVTVIVGGYQGGYIYRMWNGQAWKRTMVYQCLFLPSLVFASFLVINTTAILYRSTMTIPFKTILIVLILFLVICVPLHMAGTLLGRKAAAPFANPGSFPCRVHHLKRPIPTKQWFFTPAMILTAGVVPFGCLFIEMYFILSAVWSHNKIYYVYGFMFAILLLLCLVIICVSITCTYVLLNAEDYRWQWQSFLCCAATSIYVFLYTVHYFVHSTQMSGFFQTVYYFGTSLNFCIGLGLFCGALGFMGSSKFVFLIYGNIKAE